MKAVVLLSRQLRDGFPKKLAVKTVMIFLPYQIVKL